MLLKDGNKINYAPKRISYNVKKFVYYTDKGIRELLSIELKDDERIKADELKKAGEKILKKMGMLENYIFLM